MLHGLSSSCSERGLFVVAVGRLLIVMASLVARHGLCVPGTQVLVAIVCGFSSCRSWALEHRLNSCGASSTGMWDLPR